MRSADVVVVGGGPAGLAAALAARQEGAGRVLVIERDDQLGGILNQCIHNGFGLITFKEELTGPEYAARFEELAKDAGTEFMLGSMVIDVQRHEGSLAVTCVGEKTGLQVIFCGSVVLAMGCRERPAGALGIVGFRPAGVYTAGCAQKLVNNEGVMPGREVVILGSGDIGLIMARRLTLEGAHVACVAELMPYSGGLKRNIVQCLDDFGIPLLLSHTVVRIEGKKRVEAVVVAKVDAQGRPLPGSEKRYPCDTLLLSVGLLPENELSRGAGVELSPTTRGPVVDDTLETSVPGVFACGNVLHAHDLVDYVTQEAEHAGREAARYALNRHAPAERDVAERSVEIPVLASQGVRYTVPQYVKARGNEDAQDVTIRFRVDGVYEDRWVDVRVGERSAHHKRRQILTPGQMETATVPAEALKDIAPGTVIHVSLEGK